MKVYWLLILGSLVGHLGVSGPAWSQDLSPLEKAGQNSFKKCKACHQIGVGAKNRIGPQLNNLFGRKAADVVGFKYSIAIRRQGDDGLVWHADKLDAYIENPKNLVTGTRMNFAGIKDAEERIALLAYLRRFSDNPSDIPEADPTATDAEHDIDPAILALKGDPEYGEYLSSECATCHQTSGVDDGVPSIIAWPDEDFVIAMHAYKKKLRIHPVMQMVSGRLSDDEIAALAAYFGGLAPE
ncbi:c-type cytochrome [Cohaesibacter celericrescens]|uniref:c-type cytochrome n=1 Tax=Cohaesibacter celericrescens TaxID=2067669 RepID=UPI001AECB690|nr:c-type cytochrome [Cohaesibacter celericrescens]